MRDLYAHVTQSAQTDDANLQALFHIQKGPHTLALDEFKVSTEPLTSTTPAEGKAKANVDEATKKAKRAARNK